LLVHFHGHFPGFPIPGATQHMPLSQEPTEEQPSDDVARASTAFYADFAKQDLESMSRAWAHDDTVSAIHPSSPAPFLGRDEVMKSWKQAFTDIESVFIRHRFAIRHILGSVAWVVDMSEFHALLAEGAARSTYTRCCRRKSSKGGKISGHGPLPRPDRLFLRSCRLAIVLHRIKHAEQNGNRAIVARRSRCFK
jgi:hypothetical protein